MLYYLKWIREHRDREIEQLISANSWYNTVLWLVSKSQTVLWFADLNLLKEELQGCDKQTDKQIDLIDCWTASFAVKKSGQGQNITVTIKSNIKLTIIQEMIYIMLSEINRSGQLLGLNWTADFSWHSWSNTVLWLVSWSETVLWLAGKPLKDNFNFVHRQTDWSDRLLNCFFRS